MTKTYTYKDMIILHCTIDERAGLHEDFPKYRRGLVDKLQGIFQVNLKKPPKIDALFMLFQSTARSYRYAGTHPLSGYQDASLIHVTLKKIGNPGLEITDLLRDMSRTSGQAKEQYQQLLYNLYDLIWGKTNKVVTSQDLAELGFDDSKEPDWVDYF